jgi:exodeoxyribonuclease III
LGGQGVFQPGEVSRPDRTGLLAHGGEGFGDIEFSRGRFRERAGGHRVREHVGVDLTRVDGVPKQSRYIEAAVNGVLIACIYLPNGNPQPAPKFDYKLAWFERLIVHADTLFTTDAPVVLAGDFNVVPTDFDIYPTKSWAKDALVQPAPRACFQRLLDQGWVDAIRTLHPSEQMFTFWDYKRQRWERDAGLRLDHLLLNPVAAAKLADAGVDRQVRGEDGASDHAPAWIELARTAKPISKRRPRHSGSR